MKAPLVARIREAAHSKNIGIFERLITDETFRAALTELRAKPPKNVMVIGDYGRQQPDDIKELLNRFGMPGNFYNALWVYVTRTEVDESSIPNKNYSFELQAPYGPTVLMDENNFPHEMAAASAVKLIAYNILSKDEGLLALEELREIQEDVMALRVVDPLLHEIYELDKKRKPVTNYTSKSLSGYRKLLDSQLETGAISHVQHRERLKMHTGVIKGVVRTAQGGYSSADIAKDIKKKTGRKITPENVRSKLNREKKRRSGLSKP